MLHNKLAFVVAEVISPKEEGELRVVFLFLHCHLFKLRTVPSHELGQLVNDIPQLLICSRQKEEEEEETKSDRAEAAGGLYKGGDK